MSLDWRKRHWVRKTLDTGVNSALSLPGGVSTFASPYREITFTPATTNLNYSIVFDCSSNPDGRVGDVWYEIINENTFRVFRTGITVASFRWNIVPNSIGSKLAYGQEHFAGTSGVLVTLGFNMPSTDYSVFITPRENTLGQKGDVWYEVVSTSEFRVFNTGAARTMFQWTVTRNRVV